MDTGGGPFSSSLTQFVKSGPLSGGIRGRGTGGRRGDAYRWILDIYAIVYTCAACGRDAWTAFAPGPAGGGSRHPGGRGRGAPDGLRPSGPSLVPGVDVGPAAPQRAGPPGAPMDLTSSGEMDSPCGKVPALPGRLDGAFAPGPAGAGRDIRAGKGEEPLTACGLPAPHSYRALMFARMSLMTSEISGVVFLSFSIRSMEWSTVVWSRFSNSLPISLRERLVISRMR